MGFSFVVYCRYSISVYPFSIKVSLRAHAFEDLIRVIVPATPAARPAWRVDCACAVRARRDARGRPSAERQREETRGGALDVKIPT
jgi:hypothetical protein